MYYTKSIDVYSYQKHKNEYKETVKGYVKKSEGIACDVQPSSSEKIEKAYGYKIECTNVIYCDNEIFEDDIVLYKGETYEVTKSIPWDDYYVTTINKKVVKLDG